MMGYGYGGQSMGWMMAANGIFWVILLVLAVVLVGRILHPTGIRHPGARSSGLDILEERYARGEIQRDEYLQKKKDIFGRGAS
jgi:putative membrane protein